MIIELPDSTEESVHDGHEFTVRKKILISWFTQGLKKLEKVKLFSCVHSDLQNDQ